jgi:hypothetical protein
LNYCTRKFEVEEKLFLVILLISPGIVSVLTAGLAEFRD